MSNPVLFLDIDGVLNSHRSFVALGSGARILDPVAVRLVERLVTVAGASIVWSTSWRKGDDWKDFIMGALSRTPLVDLDFWRPRVRHRTPERTDGHRGSEIGVFIRAHGIRRGRIVILDDDGDMEPFMDRLVQTSYSQGLCWEHYERALKLWGLEA